MGQEGQEGQGKRGGAVELLNSVVTTDEASATTLGVGD